MKPERWRRVEEVYHVSLQVATGERVGSDSFVRYSQVTKAWTEFAHIQTSFNWWVWSRDSKFIYYTTNNGIYRIPLSTAKSEFYASFRDVKLPANDAAGVMSMSPDHRPAIMSDASVQQIYRLEWKK